eukprot:335694-Hanusia_phi.AAC.18
MQRELSSIWSLQVDQSLEEHLANMTIAALADLFSMNQNVGIQSNHKLANGEGISVHNWGQDNMSVHFKNQKKNASQDWRRQNCKSLLILVQRFCQRWSPWNTPAQSRSEAGGMITMTVYQSYAYSMARDLFLDLDEKAPGSRARTETDNDSQSGPDDSTPGDNAPPSGPTGSHMTAPMREPMYRIRVSRQHY